jgi:superfamily II DNA or RNA helicase
MALIAQVLNSAELSSVVVWLAHSEELCEQAATEFEKCWACKGDREVAIGRYFGDHKVNLAQFTGGILVAGLAKLYSRSKPEQSAFLKLKESTILVVMDEAHQATAPTYQHLLDMLAPHGGAALLGLSATPGRSLLDLDQDKALADVFARTKIVLQTPGSQNPVEYLQSEGYLATPEYKFIPYEPSIQLTPRDRQALADGLDISEAALRRLGDDTQRNLLLIREILFRSEGGSKIIVFACSVAHANDLADTLVAKGVRAAAVSALTPTSQRRQILEAFKAEGPDAIQVVCNYAVLTTGFDAPKTRVAVVARPTQSVVLYSQMIGRAMRGPRVGGNQESVIVTVQDQIPGFRTIYESFTHWEDVW